MTDDLNAPLGWNPPDKRAGASRAGSRLALTLCGLTVATLGAVLWRNALVQQPSLEVVTAIEPAPPFPPPPAPVAAPTAPVLVTAPTFPLRGAPNDEPQERPSGVRVRRGTDAASSGPRVIHVEPEDVDVRLPLAPDPRVTESGPQGPLPRISREGLRPMDVYARPYMTTTALSADAPRVAVIVGGVGLTQQGSDAALALPEAVTLAFPPYGSDLSALAARARARGHETLLQAPMEPFDYPRNNPGPHTLIVDRTGHINEDLHWLMSRFSGYAGVVNYLGGRFMADDTALTATLAEIANRGLYFIDDGEARQSRVTTIAPDLSLPHAVVDATINAHDSPQAIDAALAQLELRAREKGSAIGFVNAAPEALTRIGRFLAGLEKRGLALAPVSAVLAPVVTTATTPNAGKEASKNHKHNQEQKP